MIDRVIMPYVSFTITAATEVTFDNHDYYHGAGYSNCPPCYN